MTRRPAAILTALTVSAGSLAAWLATEREVFTKTVRLSQTVRDPDPDDFLDLAKTRADGKIHETVCENGFWFGLLPSAYPRLGHWAPSSEWASVASIGAPVWIVAVMFCLPRRRPGQASGAAERMTDAPI